MYENIIILMKAFGEKQSMEKVWEISLIFHTTG